MSDLIEQLASERGISVRPQGALRLIRFHDSARIVEACRSSKLLILGIEAFKLSEGKVIPDTDFIADFSSLASQHWDSACDEAARSAEAFFAAAKGRTDLWFDFILKRRT